MIGSVVKLNLDVNNGISGKNTALHSAFDTGVNSRDIFLRDSTADNGVDELIALACLVG